MFNIDLNKHIIFYDVSMYLFFSPADHANLSNLWKANLQIDDDSAMQWEIQNTKNKSTLISKRKKFENLKIDISSRFRPLRVKADDLKLLRTALHAAP